MEDWRHGGFGLYLHWPYCASKCPYCDFNSHVADRIDESRWKRAYLAEIDRVAAETPGRVLNTVFFGGGTPSLMSPDLVTSILEQVRARWPMANDAEITIEANPGSVEAGRFRGYAEAGVNRVSMGVQALDDASLRRLGRMHSAAEARAAFDIARSVFARVSFDLIYARQSQTIGDWSRELDEALSMAVDHLSLYQLTVEDGTVFGARAALGKLRDLPDDEVAADMYLKTQEICETRGLSAYEISNYAAPGAESRHNLIYWRYGDYAGIGPGAHGRLTLAGMRLATTATGAPAAWLEQVETHGSGEAPREFLSGTDQAAEYLMMSLRLAEGSDLSRHARLGGAEPDGDRLGDMQQMGLIEREGDIIRATAAGRPLLNAILREMMA